MELKTDKYEIWPFDQDGWLHAVYTEDTDTRNKLRKLGFVHSATYRSKGLIYADQYLGNPTMVQSFLRLAPNKQ